MNQNRHERTDADRERDRRDKARQRERAKSRPDALIFPDEPAPGRVPAGFGSHRAKGRGNVVAPPPPPEAESVAMFGTSCVECGYPFPAKPGTIEPIDHDHE